MPTERNVHIDDLKTFLPKNYFLERMGQIDTFIEEDSYKYVLGGVALYIMMTNVCRSGELTNMMNIEFTHATERENISPTA